MKAREREAMVAKVGEKIPTNQGPVNAKVIKAMLTAKGEEFSASEYPIFRNYVDACLSKSERKPLESIDKILTEGPSTARMVRKSEIFHRILSTVYDVALPEGKKRDVWGFVISRSGSNRKYSSPSRKSPKN